MRTTQAQFVRYRHSERRDHGTDSMPSGPVGERERCENPIARRVIELVPESFERGREAVSERHRVPDLPCCRGQRFGGPSGGCNECVGECRAGGDPPFQQGEEVGPGLSQGLSPVSPSGGVDHDRS
jgi:hypothetical protein